MPLSSCLALISSIFPVKAAWHHPLNEFTYYPYKVNEKLRLTISNQPGKDIPSALRNRQLLIPMHMYMNRRRRSHTAVIGIRGACGRTNLTSSSLFRRIQPSTADDQPNPVSPRPCKNMTVAVCFAVAAKRSGFARGRAILMGSEADETGL